MKRTISLLLAMATMALASCGSKSDDVRVVGVEGFDISSLSSPSLTLEVENLSGKKLQARDGNLVLKRLSGQQIAEVSLDGTVSVPKRSRGLVEIPFKLRITDPIFMLNSALGRKIDVSELTVTGEVTVKVGMARRKVEVQDMPLPRFLAMFGISENDVKNFRI